VSKTRIAVAVTFCLFCTGAGWAQDDIKAIFLDKCSVCHGEDGAGKTAKGKKLKVKDIHVTVKTESEDEMIKIATEGKGKDMDGFGKDYKAAQIKGLVQYYRSLAK
jgi:mono/diheme cytochrome c family protein